LAASARQRKPADIRIGNYLIRKTPKPEFPRQPWDILVEGNDKPIDHATDRLQAQQIVAGLQAKEHSDLPSPAAQKDEANRKQNQPGTTKHDAG
jgi:hypothetical protein